MSKAFTKEDTLETDLDPTDKALALAGGKNYITPLGAGRLRKELKHLLDVLRPQVTEKVAWAASLGDRSENADYQYNKKKLREIDRRIHFLTKRLESVEVVDPAQTKCEDVRFGATVEIRYESGQEKRVVIVGIDEIDLSRGHISWVSPLGRTLLKGRRGDFVLLKTPKGEEEIEILSVAYLPIE